MPGRVPYRIAWIAGLLACILIAGTTGFMLIVHYPWFDAFSMTITTVG